MARGQTGRKFGRHEKRSPAMARYRNENRMARNKRLAIEKESRIQGVAPDKLYRGKIDYTPRKKTVHQLTKAD